MDYKKIYNDVLKKICERSVYDFDNIIEQDKPEFANKLIINENANNDALFSMKLNESVADEKDYKNFCEYIYAYIGLDFDTIIGNKGFKSFKKGK